MNFTQLSKLLGWFSIGLGAFELLAPHRISKALGLRSSGLVQAFGAREVAAGLMVLTQPDTAMPIWSRVIGDGMDAAVLATALRRGNSQRGAAAGALLFVMGAAVLDLAVATALDNRKQQALATARRTRVKPGLRALV